MAGFCAPLAGERALLWLVALFTGVGTSNWNALLELLPSRRKARFGDLDYDWEHSVDTTRSNVGAGTQFLTGIMARPYFATEPWLFEQIMEALHSAFSNQQSARVWPTARLRDFTFIDLGCGKGRVLLMASDYPFKKIIGVEFMPELHRAAQKNIARLFIRSSAMPADRSRLHGCAGFSVSCTGRWWSICSILFLRRHSRRCWRICGSSVEQTPRPVYIAYRFTEFENLLAQEPWLEKIAGAEQWAVYRNRREIRFF